MVNEFMFQTYIGDILVSINPYKGIPELYGEAVSNKLM